MRIGSLFSGGGGLDLAVEEVFAGQVAWHCEQDTAASRVLASHWPDVPNLGDITQVDWTQVEPVDVLRGGYPCQPFSGRQLGEADERYLWPEFARAVSTLRPRHVVLENVAGHLVRGFAAVLESLTGLGFDAEWTLVRASDVGAPHRRGRLFVVATDPAHVGQERRRPAPDGRPATELHSRAYAPDAPRDGRDEGRTEPARGSSGDLMAAQRGAESAADPEHGPSDIDWGRYGPAIRRWEHTLGRPAPAPTETGPKGGQRLSPRFVEWMQGWPPGWVDVGISRNDQLKILGNGVVPQQAAAAIRFLLAGETVAA